MGDYDFVDVGQDYVWVDTPGYEFVDDSPHVVKLRHLQVKDVSTIYKAIDVSIIYGCRVIVGGEVMMNNDFEIFLGSGNIIDLQLTAENADTGVVSPLTQALMALITNCKLVFDGIVVDSAADGVGLGADQVFDNVTNADDGILSITLGAQALQAKTYRTCRLSVKFSNADLPKVINLRRRAIVFPAI